MYTTPKYRVLKMLTLFIIIGSILLTACAGQPANQSVPQSNSGSAGSNPNPSSGTTTTGTNPTNVSFSKDIEPLLQATCVKCHGGQKTSKGLDLKTFDSLMAGSQNGPVLIPSDAANSKLIQSVQSGKMPKEGPKLTPEQIQLLISWVNSGAANN